jgi:hypothetical protein
MVYSQLRLDVPARFQTPIKTPTKQSDHSQANMPSWWTAKTTEMHDVFCHVCECLQRFLHVSEEDRVVFGVILTFDFKVVVFPYCYPHYHLEILLNNAVCVPAGELSECVTLGDCRALFNAVAVCSDLIT